MGLRIRFEDGPRAGRAVEFPDNIETIVMGRDPRKCQVVFPPDQTKVGREHCALRRELGEYKLQLTSDNLVLVNGEPAIDGEEIGVSAELQLGSDGPRLARETTERPGMATVVDQRLHLGKAAIIRDAGRAAKKGKRAEREGKA